MGWTEQLGVCLEVHLAAFPKTLALAERLWTPNDNIMSFADFYQRLPPRLQELKDMGISYQKLSQRDFDDLKSPNPQVLHKWTFVADPSDTAEPLAKPDAKH